MLVEFMLLYEMPFALIGVRQVQFFPTAEAGMICDTDCIRSVEEEVGGDVFHEARTRPAVWGVMPHSCMLLVGFEGG